MTLVSGFLVADVGLVAFVVFVVVVKVFVGVAVGDFVVFRFHFGGFGLVFVVMMTVVIFEHLNTFHGYKKISLRDFSL